jgi:hypothetical protein
LVHRAPEPGGPASTARLHSWCVDCDTRLDRFGLDPVITDRTLTALQGLGYLRLDAARPVAAAGCFATTGCEGCSKIESRPW